MGQRASVDLFGGQNRDVLSVERERREREFVRSFVRCLVEFRGEGLGNGVKLPCRWG